MKAFFVTNALIKARMQVLLPDWKVVCVGKALGGYRFDTVVIVQDYSRSVYLSENWANTREAWMDNLSCKIIPNGEWYWLSHHPVENLKTYP